MITIYNDKYKKLSDLCLKEVGMTYGKFCSILKKKDIKIDGVRVKTDSAINLGCKVEIYGYTETLKDFSNNIIYQDENILIVNKPSGIQCKKEDVTDNKLSMEDYFKGCQCVHRLDRNTSGLLILAKNENTLNEFKTLFKNHCVEKYYITLCYGNFNEHSKVLKNYIVVDNKNGISRIFDTKVNDSQKILTEYNVIQNYNKFALVEVKLITGKMHQIRATFKHIGHSIVGDTKYQNIEYSQTNKLIEKLTKNNQCLQAYKLKFNITNKKSILHYLDKKTITINYNFDNIIKLLNNI